MGLADVTKLSSSAVKADDWEVGAGEKNLLFVSTNAVDDNDSSLLHTNQVDIQETTLG